MVSLAVPNVNFDSSCPYFVGSCWPIATILREREPRSQEMVVAAVTKRTITE
jgi:hypothetical protein